MALPAGINCRFDRVQPFASIGLTIDKNMRLRTARRHSIPSFAKCEDSYGMRAIAVHRVALVRPFAEYLAVYGAPVERGFQRAGLPFMALENVNNYVPSERFLAFVVDMAYREGIEDLGFRVGQRFGTNCMSPHLVDQFRRSPTLHHAIQTFIELNNKTVSNSLVGLWQPPLCGHAYWYHRPSCGDRHPAVSQIGWFGLMALIDVVRLFAGPQWQPREIGLVLHDPPGRQVREQFPQTHFRLAQQHSYIVVENALLSQPPFCRATATTASSLPNYQPFADNFVGSLAQALLAYAQESHLNIELAAALCNTSKRSLQRKLAELGTSYSEVLEQARYHAACRMLQDPDLRVTDIAQTLGYRDASHFSRAFRRIAGGCPKQYRQLHAH